jgi:plastocyanin
MKSKTTLIILIVLIVAAVGYIAFSMNREAKAPTLEEGQGQTQNNSDQSTDSMTGSEQDQVATTTPKPSSGTFSDENNAMNPDVQVYEVSYDGKAYTPASLEIRVGDIVFFKNASSGSFWPASAPHPTHTIYPEFDAKAALKAGATFEFKFTKVGEWKYHDHLNPSAYGVIKVTK